jgi:hypothetical protein
VSVIGQQRMPAPPWHLILTSNSSYFSNSYNVVVSLTLESVSSKISRYKADWCPLFRVHRDTSSGYNGEMTGDPAVSSRQYGLQTRFEKKKILHFFMCIWRFAIISPSI